MIAINRQSTEPGVAGPILVTGATGFIGRYVTERLLDAGHDVRVLVRNASRLEPHLRNRLEVVRGDMRAEESVARAAAGASRIIHLAALARAWSRDDSDFEAVNVVALRSLLQAARRNDTRRFVHVSTILTLPPRSAAPISGTATRATPYERTKREAESVVEAYAAEGRETVIVHPARVYGPGPLNDANGVTVALSLYLRGRLPFHLDERGALGSYVHARDVAAGIVAAALADRPAAHYVLGGENTTFARVLALAGQVAQRSRRSFALAPGAALTIARLAELGGRVGLKPFITRDWIRVLLEDRPADSAAARRDLAYSPCRLDAGMRETVEWLLSSERGRWS